MITTGHCCRECGAALIDDYQVGEVVCSRCGMVNADSIPDMGMEMHSAVDSTRTVRASGHTSLAQHDLGLSTTIDSGNRDFGGNPIDRATLSQMSNLKRWQQRIRVTGAKDRRMSTILGKISHVCEQMGLPVNVTETASILYRSLDGRTDLRNKNQNAMAAAVVCIACKQCDVLRNIEDATATLFEPHLVRSKKKLVSRYYRTLVMELGTLRQGKMSTEKYISKISNIAEVDGKVEKLALQLAAATRNSEILDGKDPNGIAAAYLYMASILMGHGTIQRDISGAAGVSEVTIRSRCRDIMNVYSLHITLMPRRH